MMDQNPYGIHYAMSLKHLLDNHLISKVKEVNKVDSKFIAAVFCFCVIVIGLISSATAVRVYQADFGDSTALIQSQEQLIDAQQTIIDVQKGLIGGLVLDTNDAKTETADYRAKWLEAIEG